MPQTPDVKGLKEVELRVGYAQDGSPKAQQRRIKALWRCITDLTGFFGGETRVACKGVQREEYGKEMRIHMPDASRDI